MLVKWSSFATPKIELLILTNLLLCTSSRVLDVVQIMWEKPKERYMNDVLNAYGVIKIVVKNHLDQCVEVQYLFSITRLGPALFLNGNNIGRADNRNSHINLVIDNTNTIDRHKNFYILLFKEAMKINERKPTLNPGLKASKELQ